ncbi:hypothetical protein RB653_006725 [Dictyostelium firmibasis]|uniref:small monomeric GTPase n=1 Tax=Dictyostelium firmibasis TaxID=79012 RepID=A0AAN7TTH9_9MYCE
MSIKISSNKNNNNNNKNKNKNIIKKNCNNNNNFNNVVRLCVMGDGGVGKTAVTTQFVSNHFVHYYDPTIEDSYRKQISVGDKSYILDILDTAGQDELTAMRDQWIRSCEGFVLVYSITSRSSFDQVLHFREQIYRVLDRDDIPIMMIGNKSDLINERQVSYQEGKELSQNLGMSYMEVSAKSRSNIDEVFYEAICCVKRKEELYRIKSKDVKILKSKNPLKNKLNQICKVM